MIHKKIIIFCIILLHILSFNGFATTTNSIKLEAIFFDMDGVLVDTEYLKFQAWQKALKENLRLDFGLEEYKTLVGYSSETILDSIITVRPNLGINKVEKEKIIKYKNNIYNKLQSKGVQPIKNNISLLKNLLDIKNKFNVKVGIVSSASRSEILKNLEEININSASLDGIASGNDDLKDIIDPEGTNKPKPYIYQRIAKILNVRPQNCVVFEDTSAGVIAAYKAGMKVYAIPNSFTNTHDFSNAEAIIKAGDLQATSVAKDLVQLGRIDIKN